MFRKYMVSHNFSCIFQQVIFNTCFIFISNILWKVLWEVSCRYFGYNILCLSSIFKKKKPEGKIRVTFFFFQTWKYNRNKSWKHLVEKRRKFRKIFNQQKFLNLGIQPVSTYQELPQIPMENFSPILVPSDNTLPLHFIESQRRKHNQNSVR